MNSIKTALHTHIEWILTASGLLLVAIIGCFLVWGVTTLAQDLGSSLATPQAANAGQKFDLEGASKLNFRGVNSQ